MADNNDKKRLSVLTDDPEPAPERREWIGKALGLAAGALALGLSEGSAAAAEQIGVQNMTVNVTQLQPGLRRLKIEGTADTPYLIEQSAQTQLPNDPNNYVVLLVVNPPTEE